MPEARTNTVNKFKKYIDKLDLVYKQSSKTAVLDGDNSLVQMGANAGEFLIPMLDMDGLGDYDRNSGYVQGTVSITMQTQKCEYDRGRKFTVDAMDNEETAGILFGRLSAEFIRTKVVPELDAYRFAKYAALSGTVQSGTFANGKDVLNAIRAAKTEMQNNEVGLDNLVLFIDPGLNGAVQDVDTTTSKAVMSSFSQVIEVPQARFYTGIDLLDGKTDDELLGGFKPSSGAYRINFQIMDRNAVIQFQKHVVNKIIGPEANQTSDGYLFFYRAYGIAERYQNKAKGIYTHRDTTAIE